MRSNFTNNASKQETRVANLRAAQRSYVLCPPHRGKLVDDWVELAGVECPTLDLIESALSRRAQMIGVERNSSILAECRRIHSGRRASWVEGDLINLVMSRDTCLQNAGVLNYDGFHTPGAPLEEALEILGDFAVARQAQASHFLLIINVTTAYLKSTATTLRWIERVFPKYLTGTLPPDLTACVYTSKTKPMVNVQIGYGYDPHSALSAIEGVRLRA